MATSTISMPKYDNNANVANITFPTGVIAHDLKAHRYGNVVTINGYIKSTLTGDGNTTADTLATLVSEYAPRTTVRIPCGIAANAWELPESVGIVMVAAGTGIISIRSSLSGDKAVYFSCSYTV